MVSAQVSNTSENLYGSDLCLLHCLLWLFLGCWFCPHNIIFHFFFSNSLTARLRSAYLGKHETHAEGSVRAMRYTALPFHTGTSTHLPWEMLRSKWFGTGYTLLSDTFVAVFLPDNCHQPSTSSSAASCITKSNHSTRSYCSLQESKFEQNRYCYSLGG